jgi:hypothetical protein
MEDGSSFIASLQFILTDPPPWREQVFSVSYSSTDTLPKYISVTSRSLYQLGLHFTLRTRFREYV